jgi:uncharacterized membrane protein YfcA
LLEPSMTYVMICVVALGASGLTFFSGFGLGTLLLPAFSLFMPVEEAVAMTAVVHLVNSLFKVLLVGRHADRRTLFYFGIPAITAAMAGAWLLGQLATAEPLFTYPAFGRTLSVMPVKLSIGILLAAFAVIEVLPACRGLAFHPRFMPLGGLLSGFFGGLSGMQGALRAAFLARSGLSTAAFVATGAVIASLVDVSRLGVYAGRIDAVRADLDWPLLAVAVAAALAGALLGKRWLSGITMDTVQRIVAALLVLVAVGLMSGVV